jgi:hypothetical protein
VDEVGSTELGEERRDDVCEENDAFRYIGSNEVEGCGEDDYVEDIVDETC